VELDKAIQAQAVAQAEAITKANTEAQPEREAVTV
jgi:hypothetical protein